MTVSARNRRRSAVRSATHSTLPISFRAAAPRGGPPWRVARDASGPGPSLPRHIRGKSVLCLCPGHSATTTRLGLPRWHPAPDLLPSVDRLLGDLQRDGRYGLPAPHLRLGETRQ
jgi:hypothetical protein